MPKISEAEHGARMARAKHRLIVARANQILADQFDPDRVAYTNFVQTIKPDWHPGLWTQHLSRLYRDGKSKFQSAVIDFSSGIT